FQCSVCQESIPEYGEPQLARNTAVCPHSGMVTWVHPTSTTLNFWQQAFMAQPNYQKVNIAPTAMVGGDSWDQIAATSDEQISGQTQPVNAELVVMADNHPATSPTARSWQIQYSTYTNDFAQMNAHLFQPMLQSFAFA